MAATYWKVPFEWTARSAPPNDRLGEGLSWLTGLEMPEPVELVADVLASSPGPEDRQAVETLGGEQAARRTLQLAPGFSSDEPSRRIEEGLTRHDHTGARIDAPSHKPTVEELRAQSRALVDSMPGMDKLRERKRAAQAEQVGLRVDQLLLEERLLTEAEENGEVDYESAQVARFNILRELGRVHPPSLEAFAMTLNDLDIDGLSDDETPPDQSELSGNRLLAAVAKADRLEEGYSKLAHSQAMIAGLTSRNQKTFEDGLRELEIVGDGSDTSYYEAVSDYAAATLGYRPSEIAAEHPDEALAYMERAQDQLAHYGRGAATSRFKKEILSADDGSVASGLETGEDRVAAKLDALNTTIRRASGEPDVTIPAFDPNLEIPETREEREDPSVTVGEFRRSVLEPEEKDVAHGFTVGGEAVSMAEAEQAAREANPETGERAIGVHPLGN